MMQFSKLRLLHPDVAPVTSGLMGVMDLGSSAVNLTIYDVPQSQQGVYKIIDKIKIDTAAGSARTTQGHFSLGQEIIVVLDQTLESLAERLHIHQPDYVVATATSVFRDAQNGPAWCAEQQHKRGWLINLIDGETEAHLSALGALSNMGCDNGLVIDQGGGSLELYDVATGRCASFPFGVYSLMNLSDRSPLRAAQMVEDGLKKLGWPKETTGDLVVVGRAMRTIGTWVLKSHETRNKFVTREAMLTFSESLMHGRIIPDLFRAYPGYETRIPYRAAVLRAVFNATGLHRMRFADYALREGIFLTQTGQVK